MKSEQDPITDDEMLLRLIDFERFSLPLSPHTFEPKYKKNCRVRDVDGISLFRESCQSVPKDILKVVAEDKRSRKGIVRIPVTEIRSLGLSIEPSKIDEVKGHIVIPELKAALYEANKLALQPKLLALATIASRPENIAHKPESEN